MKILLLFPPHWTPAMPHLALPTLTAHLRGQGLDVIERDLNVETFDHILTRRYLEATLDRLHDLQRPQAGRPSRPQRPPHPQLAASAPNDLVRRALVEGPELARQVEAAAAVLRSDAFFDGPRGVAAFEMVNRALALASLPYHPAALSLTDYRASTAVDSSRDLRRAAADPASNMFLDIFRAIVLPDVERLQPDLVGISIPTMGQMLAAATLAHLIKAARLPCHVTAGGPHITMLRESLPRARAFFDLFDSAVVFDGEEPLARLAEALAGGGSLDTVPNLIYRDRAGGSASGEASARVSAATAPADEPQLPRLEPRTPDFRGLPLDRYLSPRLVLPLLSSRGCYHGKCAFCNVGYGAAGHYRPVPPEHVLAQMAELKETYGARHIFFSDEAITPRHLRVMSAELSRQGSPFHWCGCVRFEPSLSKELLESAAAGGCRMLLFGLETAAEPMIRRMLKGTDAAEMGRILEDAAAAGVWNHTFFFFGFPGETLEQAQETVNFVYQHQTAVHSASPGAFVLERYSPAFRSPARYGIRRILPDPRKDLAIYFAYEPESGMDEQTANLVADRFVDALPDKRYGHFYANDVWRFLYASNLREEGNAFPTWLADES